MIVESTHSVYSRDARAPWPCASAAVHLIVTSPPYPMIAMWDECFARLRGLTEATQPPDCEEDFEGMHRELDRVRARSFEALCDGGFLVINVGDATRSVDRGFRLFANHLIFRKGDKRA
jgi:DNA modification methylase